jgi:HlyD family secretion protein
MHDGVARIARIPALAALSVLLAAAVGCAGPDDGSDLIASGHVEATEVRLSGKVGGRLETFVLEEGDRVEIGQEVARFETVDLDLRLRQAEAERDLAQAQLRLRIEGPRQEEIAEARAIAEGARADLAAAERDFARMAALLERGSGTEKARDDARVRRDLAAARLEASEEAVKRLERGSRPEEIAAARASLAAAEARASQLRQNLEDSTVRSPIAGTVTAKVVEAGEIVPAGAPLAVVSDIAHAWVAVYVPGPDLPRLRLGQKARVTADDGHEGSGTVRFIASEAEFTPKNVQTRDERAKLVYKVKVFLDNEDEAFKPGMPADVEILVGDRAS